FLDAYLRHQMTIRLEDKQNGSSLFTEGVSSFERTGYLPTDLNLYATAEALHNLSTDNGRFPMRGNPLQFTITQLFGSSEEISNKITIIEGQETASDLTSAQRAVLVAKKQT